MSLLALVVLVGAFLVFRRQYRRWKEKQHAQLTSRELDMDFDTNDLEIGSMKHSHARALSDSSDAPLIKGMGMQSKRNLRSPSATSFESELYSVSMHAYTVNPRSDSPEPLPNPYETPRPTVFPPPSQPAIPIIKEPSPPPKPVVPSSLTTAEHQLTAPRLKTIIPGQTSQPPAPQ